MCYNITNGGVLSEEFFLDEPGPRQPRQSPQLPWLNIVLVVVVVVGLIVTGVATARALGALSEQLTVLNTELTAMNTELTAIKASITQSASSVQNEIGGLGTNIIGVELMAGSLSDTLEALLGEVSTLTVTVAALQEMIAAGNFTAP